MIIKYDEFITENKESRLKPEDFGIHSYEWVNGYLNCFQDVKPNEANFKKNITKMPLKFGKIQGSFSWENDSLTTLDNFPHTVTGNFKCSNNMIKNLKGGPSIVGGYYVCRNNKLTNLKHFPQKVNGSVFFDDNELTSLVGLPEEINGDLYCSNNKLSNMEGLPKVINGEFNCTKNNFMYLDDYPFGLKIKGGNNGVIIGDELFSRFQNLVTDNVEKFVPVKDDKIKLHQMAMRLDPSLVKYYRTIPPPSKKSILFN